MATTTTGTRTDALEIRGALAHLSARLATLFSRIALMSDAARAARLAGDLAQLSDAQLAARGLTRDGIVAHAFRHLTWR